MLVFALALFALLIVLPLAGAVYQRLGLTRDARRFPPPGRLIDIGGFHLHVDVRGRGSPAVVFEAGIAATSLSWGLVQPEIAELTTTVTYDRAGLGWSDLARERRDLQQVVRELDELLKQLSARGDAQGPFIVVAHSYGCLVARMYQARNPSNVAGMVLVDPMAIGEWNPPSTELRKMLGRGIHLSRRGAWLAQIGVVRFALGLLMLGGRGLPKLIARTSSGGDSGFLDRIVGQISKLPDRSWPMIQSHWSNPKCFEGMARYLETLPESAAIAAQEAPPAAMRAVPVIILTSENATGQEKAEREELAKEGQARIEVVSGSGHWIQLDRPDAVIYAVREMMMRLRGA
jgi:pimeloyl-ACP methyl ester carboxylesterase